MVDYLPEAAQSTKALDIMKSEFTASVPDTDVTNGVAEYIFLIANNYILTQVDYKCKLGSRGYTGNPEREEYHMSKLVSKITDSEVEVMRVLWEAGRELPFVDIRKKLERTSKWENSTIKTLLRRLCEKGVVLATKKDVFYYTPLVSEAEYNEYTTQGLIDRLYSGSAKNLVASLLGSKKLDNSDIEELRSLFKVGEGDE